MKRIIQIMLLLTLTVFAKAQTILPDETTEFCPEADMTFTVTVPGTGPSVASWTNSPILVQQAYNIITSGGTTTFNFQGRFRDININQVFRVNYSNSSGGQIKDFQFKNVKSLFYPAPPQSTSCPAIQPNQATVSAAICQAVNIPISFNPITWSTYGETPAYCFGSISTYEYKLPTGWKIGNAVSTGSNWILSSKNATITSSLLGGGGSTIAIRPANNCGTNLNNNQIPVYVSIIRPNSPVLQVNGASTLTLYCGDASAKTFTVVNAGACITGYEWLVANKGWYDASGSLITSNITTTTPSLTIYPSCNTANPPQAVQVKIKAGSEEITSTVSVSFSSAAPQLAISGPDEFCTSATYTVPVSPACGASVTWSLEYLDNHPNVATLSCTNCQTTTVTKYNNGTALLRATVSFPNCNTTGVYEKYIGVGLPVFRGWYNSPTNSAEPLNPWTKANMNSTNLACYTQYITTSTDVTANSYVQWQAGSIPPGMEWSQSGNNLHFFFADINQDALFSVTITNACGTKRIQYRFTSVAENCSSGTPLLVVLSPNPSASNLTVGLAEKGNRKKAKEILEIRILDKLGIVKQKWTYGKRAGSQPKQLDISRLPQDIYTIMVFDGKTWTAEKLSKQ